MTFDHDCRAIPLLPKLPNVTLGSFGNKGIALQSWSSDTRSLSYSGRCSLTVYTPALWASADCRLSLSFSRSIAATLRDYLVFIDLTSDVRIIY